jgi:hypothetical protein
MPTLDQALPYLATLLGGLFGGEPQSAQLPPWIMNTQRREAQWLHRYSKSAVGSKPWEQAALASSQGMLNQNLSRGRDQLLSQTFAGTPGAQADALARFNEGAIGARMNVTGQHNAAGMQNRLAARGQAAGIARGAGGLALGQAGLQQQALNQGYQDQQQMFDLFAMLARDAAYRRGGGVPGERR